MFYKVDLVTNLDNIAKSDIFLFKIVSIYSIMMELINQYDKHILTILILSFFPK